MHRFSAGSFTVDAASSPRVNVDVAWRNWALGAAKATSAVCSSTTVVPLYPARYPLPRTAFAPSFTIPSKLSLTARAFTGVPSLKVAPSRRVKVNVVASLLTFQDFASQGTILPVRGSWSVSESTS